MRFVAPILAASAALVVAAAPAEAATYLVTGRGEGLQTLRVFNFDGSTTTSSHVVDIIVRAYLPDSFDMQGFIDSDSASYTRDIIGSGTRELTRFSVGGANLIAGASRLGTFDWLQSTRAYEVSITSSQITFSATFDSAETRAPSITVLAGAIPEPTSWALMIAGFGLLGGAMRHRGMHLARHDA